jgi:rare lipoprotein A
VIRSGRAFRTGAALISSAFLVACVASGPPRPSGDAPSAMLPAPAAGDRSAPRAGRTEPRSERGNPPFYDVLGKRYHVLPTSAGYVQRGVASWYGRDFHGLSTSSGEEYDMHAMTAAHTTLPLPTWVEVTNLENGKRVVVKVNDRGPFVDNRLIDLSFAAATHLDMVRNGTARVEVRAVGAPLEGVRQGATFASTEQSMGVLPAAGVVTEQMYVQVGAFSQRDNAQRLLERLRASGFANPSLVSEPQARREMHRVRLGPIRDSVEFDQLNARLRSMGVSGARLVVDRLP